MNQFVNRFQISMSSIVKYYNNSPINLVMVHGLLGSKRNFRTISNSPLLGKHLNAVHLLDLRNHGESDHTQSMTLTEMAEDLTEYITPLDNVVLLGHSLGGRVIFKYLEENGEKANNLLKGVVIVDILPTKVESTYVLDLLNTLKKIPMENRTFNELEEDFSVAAQNKSIAQLIMTNIDSIHPITRRDTLNSFKWKINIDSIANNFDNNVQQDIKPKWHGPNLIICGQNSQYVKPSMYHIYKSVFPEQQNLKIIPNAGHWVHADQQQIFIETLSEFISTLY